MTPCLKPLIKEKLFFTCNYFFFVQRNSLEIKQLNNCSFWLVFGKRGEHCCFLKRTVATNSGINDCVFVAEKTLKVTCKRFVIRIECTFCKRASNRQYERTFFPPDITSYTLRVGLHDCSILPTLTFNKISFFAT